MSVILFVDMLGARNRWQHGGVAESMPFFYRFKSMVNVAARRAPEGEVLDGMIETDAALLVCKSAVEAIRVAQRLYLAAFRIGNTNSDPHRLWLRGCVVPHTPGDFLRSGSALRSTNSNITAFRYSESALEAISIEKSGFKGMRILVNLTLIDAQVRAETKIPFNAHAFIPFRQLKYSYYPPRISNHYADFLWMACHSDDMWHDMTLSMLNRLRFASRDAEELAQATATQVVFNECAAIRESVASRARRAEEKNRDA